MVLTPFKLVVVKKEWKILRNHKLVTSWKTTFLLRVILLNSRYPQRTSCLLGTCLDQDILTSVNRLMLSLFQSEKVSKELWRDGISEVNLQVMVVQSLIDILVPLVTENGQEKFSRAKRWLVVLVMDRSQFLIKWLSRLMSIEACSMSREMFQVLSQLL